MILLILATNAMVGLWQRSNADAALQVRDPSRATTRRIESNLSIPTAGYQSQRVPLAECASCFKQALKDSQCPTARVRRDGELSTVPAAALVPGDVLTARSSPPRRTSFDSHLSNCFSPGIRGDVGNVRP